MKSGWSNNTQRTELVLLIEIGCKMERMENSTGKIVDVSNLSMTMERRFGADASISADGILEGDARVVLTTHSTLTVDFVLKKGLMDSDDAQEEYFRNLYKNACDKKDLLPIDTIPTDQETLIPAFYVPIPLPAMTVPAPPETAAIFLRLPRSIPGPRGSLWSRAAVQWSRIPSGPAGTAA